jgi:fructokinase
LDPALRLGVDLGGTKTEAVVLLVEDGAFQVVAKERVATERHAGYDHIVARTAEVVREVARLAGLDALPPIGVGMPGSVTRRSGEALVKNSNTTCLNGKPFRRDLAAAVRAPIVFANDANCFALAEAVFGAAKEARFAFGVIMGTGVGGGIAYRGEDGAARVWEGAQSIAGEWGHVVLDPAHGPACYCGKRGCVEQYLSGPAIERAFAARAGEALPLADIAARAEAGDAAAKATLASTTDTFGRAIATVIDVLDPDVVVLGGGVSNLAALYDDGIAAVRRWVFNDALETRIVRHALGDSAGVLGAALLPARSVLG